MAGFPATGIIRKEWIMSMVYKLTSTVKAHLDNENNIVSPTQTLLKNGVLHTSKFMPKTISDKIIDADVVVDQKSICDNGVCKGDIYIKTNDDLTLIEQRKMMDGLTRISRSYGEPVMMPVILRQSPNQMPTPALPDNEYNPSNENGGHIETASAFLGYHSVLNFGNQPNVKSTFLKSADLISALNGELNSKGLVAIFADSSVCRQQEPVKRDCFMIIQKTSRFNEAEFNSEELCDTIETALMFPKLNVANVEKTEAVSVANEYGLIGTVSMENVQIASKRTLDQTKSIKTNDDSVLSFVSMEQNPWFVNGVGSVGNNAIKNIMTTISVPRGPRLATPLFSKQVPSTTSSVFESSTGQDLSKDWKMVNAIQINLAGVQNDYAAFYENATNIKNDINDVLGQPNDVVTNISFGKRIRVGEKVIQPMYLHYDDTMGVNSNDIYDAFKTSIDDYAGIRNMTTSKVDSCVLSSDMKDAKSLKIKTVSSELSAVKLPQVSTELKSGMLQSDLINTKETQMTM